MELLDDITSLKDYDDVPYPGGAIRNSLPSHLAMVAALCGLKPPTPSQCRVLELGCSIGANLLPMAENLPNSEFIGIDLSKRQIEQGQTLLNELNLNNIQLRHMNIMDVKENLGEFDYIICHGVYSWVPSEVQKAILTISRRHLSDNGVAYISYNTYPGWHLRRVVRDMMRYHVAELESPKEKIRQARTLLKFICESAKSHSQAYLTLLKEEAKILNDHSDYYIYHEQLESINEPLYFLEFIHRADAAGMRYLADAAISTMVAQLFDKSTFEILRDVPLLRREQYMDFLRSRTFRSSLLCHQTINPNYQMPSSNLLLLHIRLRRPIKATQFSDGNIVWDYQVGQLKAADHLLISDALKILQKHYPAWMSVQELVAAIAPEESPHKLLDALLVSFIQGVIDLAEDPAPICAEVHEKPRCTALARIQAKRGSKITNLIHQNLSIQPEHRFLIQHLDGTHSIDDLAKLLYRAIENGQFKAGQFKATQSNQAFKLSDQHRYREIVHKELEQLCALSLFAD